MIHDDFIDTFEKSQGVQEGMVNKKSFFQILFGKRIL